MGKAPLRRALPTARNGRQGTAKKEHVRVLVVDDHAVMRVGLRSILAAADDIQVVAEADSASSAIRQTARKRPDVVVIVGLPGRRSGIEAISEIRSRWPEARVLVLTTVADEKALLASIQAGASGYVPGNVSADGLVRAVRALAAGQSLIDPAVAASVLEHMRGGHRPAAVDKLAMLSAYEQRTLALLSEGRTNREIAAQLAVAPATVKKRVSSILAKLEVGRRAEAAAYLAHRRGRDEGLRRT